MKADTTPGLAPCPWCGEVPDEALDVRGTVIECPSCCVWGPAGRDAAEAVKAWNRRAPAPAPQGPTDAEIDALLDSQATMDWHLADDTRSRMRLWTRLVLARWGAPAASGAPVAWMHEEDPRRVISADQRQVGLRDGGASWKSVRAYTVPLVRRA